MDSERWRKQVKSKQQAYLSGVEYQSLLLVAVDRDPARVAAYKELMELGEEEAAMIALEGPKQ